MNTFWIRFGAAALVAAAFLCVMPGGVAAPTHTIPFQAATPPDTSRQKAAIVRQTSVVALSTSALSGTRKMVFAHYMVCCPTAGGSAGVEDFKREIREAQTRGLDGFALNAGGWNDGNYKTRRAQIYEAARELKTNFKLFVSIDFCCGNGEPELRDALQTFGAHSNQLRMSGKPVISTFGGGSRDPAHGQAKTRAAREAGGFFVPYFFPQTYRENPTNDDIAQLLRDYADLDGYFYFGAAGNGEEIASANARHARSWKSRGKVFMASVTPYYRSFGRLYETRGFSGMAREWESAISSSANWIELVTWNDWAEKTYVAPFGTPEETKLWNGDNPDFGAINYAHSAYLDASRYYINWFKTGKQPKITRDQLFYFYRTEPANASGKHIAPNEEKQGVKIISNVEYLQDEVFATAFLTAPARLTIFSGERARTFVLKSGVSHVSMPFSLGAPRFVLQRNGKLLLDKTGEQEIADRQGETRYNYFAGEAKGK